MKFAVRPSGLKRMMGWIESAAGQGGADLHLLVLRLDVLIRRDAVHRSEGLRAHGGVASVDEDEDLQPVPRARVS